MASERPQKQGPEDDQSDLERIKRVEKEIDDMMASDVARAIAQEVRRNPKALSELKANPKALLQRKGLRIPEGVEVEVREEASWCYYYCYYARRCVRYCYY